MGIFTAFQPKRAFIHNKNIKNMKIFIKNFAKYVRAGGGSFVGGDLAATVAIGDRRSSAMQLCSFAALQLCI